MPKRNSVISRLLAVLALGIAVVAVIVAVGAATGNGDADSTSSKPAATKKQQARKNRNKPKTYEVKEGDNLSMIADRTGVSVDEIEELNPDLDPQALTIGQKLKLR
ncbi:MAG: LysM peptidoglycan-binding domain-containing protein [Actinomycetota bacterium]|nr:LysM peptidoglycan-binding domain-containing protein [Actinomycetota bacterium]